MHDDGTAVAAFAVRVHAGAHLSSANLALGPPVLCVGVPVARGPAVSAEVLSVESVE